MKSDRILIIIPTYNEIENIERIIREIRNIQNSIHILVVDDNSPDGTGQKIKELEKSLENIFLIEREGKLGLGTAYVAGFKFALQNGYEYIFEMDADSSHDPKEILRECIRTATVVAKSKNIDIAFRNEMEVPLIDLDGQRIQRVLDNYLSNAIKFSSPGGKVETWIDVRPSEVEVIVRDNGPGLTEEEQKIVFEPFERAGNRPTAGEGSTGLGLAIVKKFIEAHQGRAGVRSSKHEWSEFYFTLPIKPG